MILTGLVLTAIALVTVAWAAAGQALRDSSNHVPHPTDRSHT